MKVRIERALYENGHLSDGDVCTLKVLKDALSKVGAGDTVTEGPNAPREWRAVARTIDGVVRRED